MLNKLLLIGHVGAQPEFGSTQSGKAYAKFSLATTERWRDKNGKREERTDWHNIVVWNDALIELCRKYVRKGSKLFISSKLEHRSWDKDDGSKGYISECVLKSFGAEIVLLDKKPGMPEPEYEGYERGEDGE